MKNGNVPQVSTFNRDVPERVRLMNPEQHAWAVLLLAVLADHLVQATDLVLILHNPIIERRVEKIM